MLGENFMKDGAWGIILVLSVSYIILKNRDVLHKVTNVVAKDTEGSLHK